MRLSSIFKWLLCLSLISGVGLWLAELVIPAVAGRTGTLIGSSFIVMALCVPSLCCATTIERGRLRPLMWSGIGAAAASAAGWIGLVLFEAVIDWEQAETWAKCIAPFSVWTGFCMVLSLLWMQRINSMIGMIIRAHAVVAAAGLAVCILTMAWFERSFHHRTEETVARLIGVFAVLTVAGTLLTMVVARLRQLTTDQEEEEVVRLPLTVWCPRCGVQQSLQTGGANCESCGLLIRVMVP